MASTKVEQSYLAASLAAVACFFLLLAAIGIVRVVTGHYISAVQTIVGFTLVGVLLLLVAYGFRRGA